MSAHTIQTVTLGLTGASGMPYGIRLLECLLKYNKTVWLVYTQAAQIVAQQEMGLQLPSSASACEKMLQERYGVDGSQLRVFGQNQWSAPPASGTHVADAMVVCPATMGSVAAMAYGMSDNLLERAADVTLKEGRQLIIVPREAPLSVIHLENLLKLARLGVCVLPPSPGFYQHPKTVDDMVNFVVARVLDQLRIDHDLLPRWGE